MNKNRIDYVLYHLQFSCGNIKQLFKYFVFSNTDYHPTQPAIVFRLTNQDIDLANIKWINDIPILFPLSNSNLTHSFDEKNNLIFHHDFISSAFYLLSAFQEIQGPKDAMGRFKFENSLQNKLNIVGKPVVNYYFKMILQGIEEFCSRHQIPFGKTKPFENFAFLLSHDIDRIYFHHPKEMAGRLMQLTGLRKKEYTTTKLLSILMKDVVNVWRYKKRDAWWKFAFMNDIEQQLNIYSSYYFLPKTNNRLDSRYHLTTPQVCNMMKNLIKEKHEVGLHVPLDNYQYRKHIEQIKSVTHEKNIGVRRHFLKLEPSSDFLNDVQHNVAYDTSYGFSETEGFRNSYCLPFKPYNFESEEIIDLWVVPLMAMDVTFLFKKEMPFNQIASSINALISESQKFGGIFTLLWHNCRFDEHNFPGISNFYKTLLTDIINKKPVATTGLSTVKAMESQVSFPIVEFNQIAYHIVDF